MTVTLAQFLAGLAAYKAATGNDATIAELNESDWTALVLAVPQTEAPPNINGVKIVVGAFIGICEVRYYVDPAWSYMY